MYRKSSSINFFYPALLYYLWTVPEEKQPNLGQAREIIGFSFLISLLTCLSTNSLTFLPTIWIYCLDVVFKSYYSWRQMGPGNCRPHTAKPQVAVLVATNQWHMHGSVQYETRRSTQQDLNAARPDGAITVRAFNLLHVDAPIPDNPQVSPDSTFVS